KKQRSCHITYTNPAVHDILKTGFKFSPMFAGRIGGVGPRYCPSIEDKYKKFPDKERHQIFLEPTSLQSFEYYPNGMSTSLPLRVQQEFMRSIVGLEKVNIVRPGYAIEYDFVFPTQLKASLECKEVEGLFLAGQINGTSGYEEAAAQGLMAGINAALLVQGKDAFVLERDQAYIGVLIDDLVSQGTNEPYRMFTSRAEYRLLLREDNADARLSQLGYDLGLLGETKYKRFKEKQEQVAAFQDYCEKTYLVPSEKSVEVLGEQAESLLPHRFKINDYLKRPDANIAQVGKLLEKPEFHAFSDDVTEYVETLIKYHGYIQRQESQVAKYKKVDALRIPNAFDYAKIGGLSNEVVQKLKEHKPQNLGQASRISGVTPAAITILLVALNKKEKP
ncbi:MAG: FAD-dependent oxidoreductase, partial [SAR324 cluster bacterium]|nr:FAD-dependent oxidoreductase [SAR324 cluster bacterium]